MKTSSGHWLTDMSRGKAKPGHLLYVDLVPSSACFSNLRSELKASEWDMVRRAVYKSSNYRCEICGGKGLKHPVEAHERWSFDEVTGIQKLEEIEALCPACHEVTHIGLAETKGRLDIAIEHFCYVNNWSLAQANSHINAAFKKWERLSKRKWILDCRPLLEAFDLSVETRNKILDHSKSLQA